MPGGVVGKSLNLGYAGSVSRSADAIITNRLVRSTDKEDITFGAAVVLNSDNTYSKFGSYGTAEAFAGVAVREVKQSTDYFGDQGFYRPGQPCDILERGSVTVICNVGKPSAGGDVFVRIKANPSVPNGVIGGFEAAEDGTNTVKITGVKWKTGKIDTNKVAEITILSRINP
ncbi:hypothetical protein EEL30_06570 [Brevibacillus laterosporus]|uniref:Uncharacterized protein n=1 Tax=Brevibacillus laterosporus TaxID=1465 RepID=A0A518V4Y7_BRELA|nr:hypothetical protein EEL30_06570 [Brevibacillus laterosporus]